MCMCHSVWQNGCTSVSLWRGSWFSSIFLFSKSTGGRPSWGPLHFIGLKYQIKHVRPKCPQVWMKWDTRIKLDFSTRSQYVSHEWHKYPNKSLCVDWQPWHKWFQGYLKQRYSARLVECFAVDWTFVQTVYLQWEMTQDWYWKILVLTEWSEIYDL